MITKDKNTSIKKSVNQANHNNHGSDKEGWEIKRLYEICEIYNGGTPDTTISKFWDGNNLWITPKDMGKLKSIYADDTIRKITDEGLKNSSAKILPANSIILSSRAPIGHLAINTNPMSTNQGCKGLVLKKGIDTLFLYYFLSKSVDLLNSLGTGTTFKELSGSKLGTIEIPLPPLKEQQRIVAILDKIFVAIDKAKANAEQNLKNAKELFESYLQSVFENKGDDWEEKMLGEVCEISSKLVDPKKSEYQNIIHVGAGNIVSQKEILIDLKTAKEENLISGKFLFDDSMVLYSKIRPYLMKVIRCDFVGLCSADIYPLVPFKNKLVRDFLYYLLITKDFTEYAISGSQRAGMPKVNREHLFAYRFCVPSIKEQKSIVKKLDALSAETKKLEAIYQQKIKDLEELKKSVLQKAFSGELTTTKNVMV